MSRLKREGNPPSGQLASPVPQYWNPNTEDFEYVLGAHGAPRAILYGPNGEPISQINPLPIEGKVQLTGSIQEFAVASWDDLPPDSVPVGSVAILIGTNDIRQTDGEVWLPI